MANSLYVWASCILAAAGVVLILLALLAIWKPLAGIAAGAALVYAARCALAQVQPPAPPSDAEPKP